MIALTTYKQDVGAFPSTGQGLRALRIMPDGVSHWQGPYLQKDVPWDPWGHPFVYKYPGEHGDTPDIVSLGADGQPGGEGENADILSWK
jgi:general secretion pathway protein G